VRAELITCSSIVACERDITFLLFAWLQLTLAGCLGDRAAPLVPTGHRGYGVPHAAGHAPRPE
jgi:hypothetical protein